MLYFKLSFLQGFRSAFINSVFSFFCCNCSSESRSKSRIQTVRECSLQIVIIIIIIIIITIIIAKAIYLTNRLQFSMVYTLRGCMFTWHWGNFRPEASSLRFPLMVLHLFTWYHHAGTSHSSVSSPRLLQHGENFTPVQNLPTVSSKRETTTCRGVKSVCRWTGTGSACLMFAILNHTYFIHMKCTLK